MYLPTGKQMLCMLAVIGAVGWALIEGVLYLARHITIGWIP